METGEAQIIEKKSRFLAQLTPIHTEAEALTCLEQRRKKYWDATHHCYAYILQKGGLITRFSDDKEPPQTAGKPILDILLAAGIQNAILIVTRYFGGTKLGTGGLTRAYKDAAKAVIDATPIGRMLYGSEVLITVEYVFVNQVQTLLRQI
jgi:uncharacterized YigZ family protein